MIEKSFTKEEIHLAIVDMDGEKSPDLDGFIWPSLNLIGTWLNVI